MGGVATRAEEVAPEPLRCGASDTQDGIGRRRNVLGASRGIFTPSHSLFLSLEVYQYSHTPIALSYVGITQKRRVPAPLPKA